LAQRDMVRTDLVGYS